MSSRNRFVFSFFLFCLILFGELDVERERERQSESERERGVAIYKNLVKLAKRIQEPPARECHKSVTASVLQAPESARKDLDPVRGPRFWFGKHTLPASLLFFISSFVQIFFDYKPDNAKDCSCRDG